MNVKISQFIPVLGAAGGFVFLLLVGFDDIKFTLDYEYILGFMGILLFGNSGHKLLKMFKGKNKE